MAMITLLSLPRLSPLLTSWIRRLPWAQLRGFFESFLGHCATRAEKHVIERALGHSVMLWLCSIASMAVLIHLVGSIPVGWVGALMVCVACTAGGAIPALPGGFGTYEAGAVFALKSFGYGTEEALVIGLALHASQLLLPVVGGTFIAATEPVGIRTLVHEIRSIVKNEG